jgi:hypothetical protein
MSRTTVCEAASHVKSAILRPFNKMAKKKSLLARHLSKLGKKGGKARLETMTDDERKESARKAAQARWAKRKGPKPS